jgi:hypothetical protein
VQLRPYIEGAFFCSTSPSQPRAKIRALTVLFEN